MEAINQLMYCFSNLKTTTHLNWMIIGLAIVVNIFFILIFIKFVGKKDTKIWITSLVLTNIILIPVFKDLYTYETINNPPVAQFNKTKSEVEKDYPYCLQLITSDKQHSYMVFSKSAHDVQSTLNALNAATNKYNNDNASVILTPDKNTVIMSCSTKMINTHALNYTLIVKDYKSLTKSKVVKVDNAQYALQPTKNLKLY